MGFRVGQKVVCVDDDAARYQIAGHLYCSGLDGLTRGMVYTIRGFARSLNCDATLLLEEIIRSPDGGPVHFNREPGFFPDRFRPLVEHKTSLPACLTALLDSENHSPMRKEAIPSETTEA